MQRVQRGEQGVPMHSFCKALLLVLPLLWLYLVFWLLALVLPSRLALLLLLGLHYLLLQRVLKVVAFPGSSALYMRYLEHNLAHRMATRGLQMIHSFRQVLLKASFSHASSAQNLVKGLEESIVILRSLGEKGIATSGQLVLLEETVRVVHLTKQTHLKSSANGVQMSVYDYIQCSGQDSRRVSSDMHVLQGEAMWQALSLLEHSYSAILDRKGWLRGAQGLATLDYYRESLLLNYECQQIQVDGIEGMVFHNGCPSGEGSLMIFCQPNAGFYELMEQDTTWLDIYQRLRIRLVIWNYPGYGKSKGGQGIPALIGHGERLVDYVRQAYSPARIGIQGESMGGAVATGVARNKDLHFLCADRTFSRLSMVVEKRWWLQLALITLSDWDLSIADMFVEYQGYKVLGHDSLDEMIGYKGALREGLARHRLRRLQGKEGLLNSSTRWGHLRRFCQERTFSYQHPQVDLDGLETLVSRMARLKQKEPRAYEQIASIDAGGVPLQAVLEGRVQGGLQSWVANLGLWGSCLPQIQVAQEGLLWTDNMAMAKNLLQEIDQHLEAAIWSTQHQDPQLHQDLLQIRATLKQINRSVQVPNQAKTKEQESLMENSSEQNPLSSVNNSLLCLTNYTSTSSDECPPSRYGHLLPLFQGHNGAFTRHQLTIYIRHLQNAQFLPPDYYL